jgi:hypothetical protein
MGPTCGARWTARVAHNGGPLCSLLVLSGKSNRRRLGRHLGPGSSPGLRVARVAEGGARQSSTGARGWAARRPQPRPPLLPLLVFFLMAGQTSGGWVGMQGLGARGACVWHARPKAGLAGPAPGAEDGGAAPGFRAEVARTTRRRGRSSPGRVPSSHGVRWSTAAGDDDYGEVGWILRGTQGRERGNGEVASRPSSPELASGRGWIARRIASLDFVESVGTQFFPLFFIFTDGKWIGEAVGVGLRTLYCSITNFTLSDWRLYGLAL